MTKGRQVEILRVYEDDGHTAGLRVLVDRLWPRGIAKSRLHMDQWAKDLAPTTALRTWYGHDPERFAEFARRYRAELEQAPADEELTRLRRAAGSRRILLLTATKDVHHSGAEVLRGVLSEGTGS